jgi:hypothetical protein
MTVAKGTRRYLLRIRQAIGLLGTLALGISIASPADDAVQQEFVVCSVRHRAVRLLQATYPSAAASRIIPVKALPVTYRQRQLTTHPTIAAERRLQLRGAILTHKTGNRSPP